jgi:iron complex outermembrane receptor protein
VAPLPSYAQAPLAHAPEEPSEAIELIQEEETVSIAARHEQPISEAPANVYVITDEDIRTSGAKDLPTILRRIPGIEVMQTTGADFNVSVRGDNQLRANKLLVMVDGRSIYLDVQGEVLWRMIPITLPEIKRIEVLKGPASVLYGFNAFDGIINIITKSPEEMKGATVQFGGGEFGSITAAAIAAGTGKVFGKEAGYRISYGRDQNNKWSDRNSLAFRSNKFNIQTNYALSSVSSLTVQGGLIDSNNFDGPIVANAVVSQRPEIGYVNAVYERPNFFVRAWWQNLDRSYLLGVNPLLRGIAAIPFANQQEGNTYNIEAQHAVEFGAHRLTYGLNYRHNTYTDTRFDGRGLEDRFGLYVQEEWKMTPTLMAVAGVRYDMDTFINPTVSPRGAFIYTPIPDHTFRLSGSVGYRPPTITETRQFALASFSIPGFPTTIGVLRGNPNLAPEQIISYELGYQGWYMKHRLRVRAALFFNHISDLIDSKTTIRGIAATFSNGGDLTMGGGEADIYGGEAGAEFLFTKWLSGFANYSYQEFGQTIRGGVARGMPRFKTNAGMRAEFDNGVSGEALLYYYGAATYPLDSSFQSALFRLAPNIPPPDPRVGSYVLLNLRGAYRFWQEKKTNREAEVAVTAFNALNDRHKEHPLGETIGSLVMGWLTVKY